jgi:hypothetical protein
MACLNCGQAFAPPRPRFCPACGQETTLRPPRLGEFVQQFGGAYFATEGALWRTLKLLLLKPGELTRQYLAGRRKHYVLPLRLYLTISLVTLLLMRVAASANIEGVVNVDLDPQVTEITIMDIGSHRAGLKDGVFYCEGFPAWLCQRLQRRIDVGPEVLQAQMAAMGERLVGNLGAAMFVMLPAFALWMQLAYAGCRLRYTEHLVFALHLHSFWFLMLPLLLPERAWLSGLARLAIVLYPLLAMQRVYGGRLHWRLLRALLVSALYGVTLFFVMAGLLLWALLA